MREELSMSVEEKEEREEREAARKRKRRKETKNKKKKKEKKDEETETHFYVQDERQRQTTIPWRPILTLLFSPTYHLAHLLLQAVLSLSYTQTNIRAQHERRGIALEKLDLERLLNMFDVDIHDSSMDLNNTTNM